MPLRGSGINGADGQRRGASVPRHAAFGLGPREYQLVQLVAQGLCNKEIAAEMGLTCGTVKEYLHHIFRKTGVQNRTMLALWLVAKQKEAQLIAATFGTLTVSEAAQAQFQIVVQPYGKSIELSRAEVAQWAGQRFHKLRPSGGAG